MNSKLAESWAKVNPEHKQKLVVGTLFVALMGGAYWYWSVTNTPVAAADQHEDFKPIDIGDGMFEDDISQSLQKTRQELTQDNQARDVKLNTLSTLVEDLSGQIQDLKTDPLKPPSLNTQGEFTKPDFPPPPSFTTLPVSNTDTSSLEQQSPLIIGGIGHVEGERLTDSNSGEVKKKVKKVYLPPSFMDAMLLTGLDASTVEGANSHPEPFLIRVQKPAVLPNAIKANLKGCFVIAHGYGALNKERIVSRLVSLNCLSEDGHAVIDTEIKGYVADGDGKSGLKGIVVSKQGAHLARMFVAGVIGGFGKVAEASASSVTIAPTTATATQVFDTDRLVTAGLGSGIADSSKELRKFYMDLAKQASPVIEVGPAKKVTVVVTEGVWIEIRETEDA